MKTLQLLGRAAYLGVLPVLCLPALARGMDAGEMTLRVTEALTGEYANCIAFYGFQSRAARDKGDNALAADYAALQYRAIVFARAFARRGRSDPAAQLLISDRIDTAIASQFSTMGGDIRLMRVLSGKYADRCRHALEDPAEFADEVLERTIR